MSASIKTPFRFVREFSSLAEMSRWSPKCVLLDLSGTIHIEDSKVEGADKSVVKLRDSGLFFRFVTNTSKESATYLLHRLNRLGFNVNRDEIFSSLTAARSYIVKKNLRPMLFLEDAALDDFRDVDTSNPNAVVLGLAPSLFDYQHLTDAFKLLKEGAELIAINKSRYFQSSKGLVLGAGAFASALEYSADKTAFVIGKPSPNFFHEAIGGFPGVNPEDCVMIGDDVRDDIDGAQAAGMKGMLVKTGKYREGDENKISPPPFHVCESVVQAIDYALSLPKT